MNTALMVAIATLLLCAAVFAGIADVFYARREWEFGTALVVIAVLCVIAATVLAVKLMGMM